MSHHTLKVLKVTGTCSAKLYVNIQSVIYVQMKPSPLIPLKCTAIPTKNNNERIPIAWTHSSFTETRSPAGPFGIEKKENKHPHFMWSDNNM